VRFFVTRSRWARGRGNPVKAARNIEDFGTLAALLDATSPGVIVWSGVAATITFYDPSFKAGPRSGYLRADMGPRVVQTAGGAAFESTGINIATPEALLLRETFGKLYRLIKVVLVIVNWIVIVSNSFTLVNSIKL
jgi:hypothetical protein